MLVLQVLLLVVEAAAKTRTGPEARAVPPVCISTRLTRINRTESGKSHRVRIKTLLCKFIYTNVIFYSPNYDCVKKHRKISFPWNAVAKGGPEKALEDGYQEAARGRKT